VSPVGAAGGSAMNSLASPWSRVSLSSRTPPAPTNDAWDRRLDARVRAALDSTARPWMRLPHTPPKFSGANRGLRSNTVRGAS
jgi:hypothetical protein